MANPFQKQIEKALHNPALQAALDANAERRFHARRQAYASLPEPLPVMRQRARSVRMETIAHLDDYLETFTRQARANGIIVHQAVDAQQAVEIVLEIARQSGAKLVAKSKTMVGEEIELNPALEAAGLKVVETDLGEYIVQLRGEPPAHIITPAVHLRRPEVGQTFHEKLGIPYTEDVEDLTTAARRVLRQTFLEADLGISGVNFGVAESGTLCIVTNEGNGRMVTTLPRVHVALMGIERLVPTLNDLALMLALLPRSATGQKITVYTSLIHGPRQAADTDGPDERHVILLDNGRRRMRNSPLAEMLNCIRCGACLNACPVFREIGGHAYIGIGGEHTPYPGPMGSVVSPGLFGQAAFANLARASSLCGACKEACPVDIDLPKLLLRVRAGGIDLGTETNQEVSALSAPQALRRGLRVYSWVARSPQRFALAQRVGGWLGRLAAGGWLRLPAVTGWGLSRDFPRPASKTFHQRWAERERLQTSAAQAEQSALQYQAAPNAPASALPLHELQEQPGRPEQNLVAQSELEERFAAELVALGGTFHLCRREELPARILAVLKEHGAERLVAWEAANLPEGLLGQVRAEGVPVSHQPDPSVRTGLTGSLAGIAETGTIVTPSGPGRPLTASLLPEVHLAVLCASDLYPTVQSFLGQPRPEHARAMRAAAALALISGPSRTADIEMTLTIGVHGPKELHVFCVEDA